MPRRESESQSNTLIIVLIVVLGGGALFGCCVCGGGVALFLLLQAGSRGTEVVFGPDGQYRSDSVLSVGDPRYSIDPLFGPKRHKLYSAQLEAGRSYQIDLSSGQFDAYLHVKDDQNVIVARDDDSGGMLNARILFRPARTGTYRIYATSLDGNTLGSYTFVIRRL